MRAFGILAVTLTLSACKTDVMIEAYTTDLHTVAETGKPMNTPIGVRISVLSETACVRDQTEMLAVLAELIAEAAYDRCEKQGFETYALFKGSAEIAPFPKSPPNKIGVFTQTTEISGGYGIVLHPDALKAAREKLPIGAKIDPADVTITIRVIADGPETEYLAVGHIFVDGKPQKPTVTLPLARREAADLRLSDVSLGELLLIGGTHAFNMGKALKPGLKE